MPIKAAACPHHKPFSRFTLPLVSTPWLRQACEPNTHATLDTSTITICADSQSAINLLKNPVFSMRAEHIDVIYHFARERVTRKDVAFKYIPTDKMAADALTKPLPSTKFNFCRTAMGINGIDNK